MNEYNTTMKKITYLLFLLIFFSCKHDFEKPYWNTNIVSPIAFTNLNLDDLKLDSTIIIDTASDNRISIIYQTNLQDVLIDSNLNLNQISTTKNVKLESINFSDKIISYDVSLGDLITSSGLSFFYPNDSFRIIPPINGVLQETVPIDANEIFQSMTLSEGFLDLLIVNNLPTDISNLDLLLRNEGETQDIVSVSIPYLNSGETFNLTEELNNQTIFGSLEIEILNADLVGTGTQEVLIQYEDALSTQIKIRDIVLFEGIAVFPSQEIFNEDTVVAFDIGDIKLSGVEVEKGGVEVIGVSTIQDTLKIEYTIPYATLNGQEFTFLFNLPPAPAGESITVSKVFDFSGYEIDLRGQYGDTVNTLYTYSRGWIDSSGIVTEISLEDSIYNTITVQNIIPSKAWGYIGSDTISGSELIDINLFDNINGSFDLEELEVNLSTKNFLGAGGTLTINKIESISENQLLELESNYINNPIEIERAYESQNNQIDFSELILDFNENNSNIDKLIELKPNSIQLDYSIITNGNDEAGFAYKGKGLQTDLEFKIPLFLTLSDFMLSDTSDFNITIPSEIQDGSFNLIAENGYPLNAFIEIILLDENNNLIEELVGNQEINAGEINKDGIVTEKKLSQIKVPFNNRDNINNAKKIGFKVTFNTQPNNQNVEFYSHYSIDLKLVANFNYEIIE